MLQMSISVKSFCSILISKYSDQEVTGGQKTRNLKAAKRPARESRAPGARA